MTAPLRRLHRAFAHNDYARHRPLHDAIEQGCAAVEADVFLVGDELLVGHGREDLRPEATLDGLYLRPLHELITTQGAVYGDAPLILLIDVKSEAEATYAALRDALQPYVDWLSTRGTQGAVEVILSGHVDLPALEADAAQLVHADGRPHDLESDPSPGLRMISAKWSKFFDWSGEGPMPADQRSRLHRHVEAVHQHQLMARFWGTTEAMWPELDAADVDLIMADDVAGIAAYFAANP